MHNEREEDGAEAPVIVTVWTVNLRHVHLDTNDDFNDAT